MQEIYLETRDVGVYNISVCVWKVNALTKDTILVSQVLMKNTEKEDPGEYVKVLSK